MLTRLATLTIIDGLHISLRQVIASRGYALWAAKEAGVELEASLLASSLLQIGLLTATRAGVGGEGKLLLVRKLAWLPISRSGTFLNGLRVLGVVERRGWCQRDNEAGACVASLA